MRCIVHTAVAVLVFATVGSAQTVSVTKNAPGDVQPARQEPQEAPPGDIGDGRIRRGFWFNVGLGFGTLGCQDCSVRNNGLSGGLSLGGTVNDHLQLGFGTTGFAEDLDGDLFTVGTLDFRVRVYPSSRHGFFLNVGIGLWTMSYAGEVETGLGLMLGVGYDIRVGSRVSITPFWNGFAMANEYVDANVGQIGVGVTVLRWGGRRE